MEKKDFYNSAHKFKLKIEALEKDKSVLPQNKNLIKEFIASCRSQGIGKNRCRKYILELSKLSAMLGKPFNAATKKDMQGVVAEIEDWDRAAWTKTDYKTALKKFYRWLEKPELIDWISTRLKRNATKLPEEMLTDAEVKLLLAQSRNERDSALLITMFETGARVGEIGGLKVKNLSFDENGAVLMLAGKTGMRRVRVIDACPYLKAWLNRHPSSDNPEAPLFLNMATGKAVNYGTIRYMLKRLQKRAGLKKKVNPHNFRHSRATILAGHLTESQRCAYLGWIQGSKMAQIYTHLSGQDTDKAILEMHGKIKPSQQKKSVLMPRVCLCGHENPATARVCEKCNRPLTLDEATKRDREKELFIKGAFMAAIKSPEYKQLIKESIKEELQSTKK